jgi:hypothetical protein
MKKSACLVKKEFFPPPLGAKTAKSGEGAAAADVAQRCSQKISFPRFVSRRRPWPSSPSAGSSRQPPVRQFANASSTFASPRLRQSLAALGSGYGLNEKPKTANGNSLARLGLRASPRFHSSVSRVFAPAPGSAAGIRITNLRGTTPFFRQPGLRASPRFGSSLTHRLLSPRLACAKAWRLWAPATG